LHTAIDVDGVEVLGSLDSRYDEILTAEALAFIATLERRFRHQRNFLLMLRQETDDRLQHGFQLDFLPETKPIRDGAWSVDPVPDDLQERRVEITGPVDAKMVINALNSGANVFMADFEDATTPSWRNLVEGQVHLADAVRGTLTWQSPAGKTYRLGDKVATLMVRPRGWHMDERHLSVDGVPMSASLFDFGLFLFHNAQALMARGSGPYFYLPKLESLLEARLWNSVFVEAQGLLGIPRGTIKATVLIETIVAAFEMDEILYQLREHSAGLNCGRWDYIFSFIKKLQANPGCVLPDRSLVTMEQHFLHSYSDLLVKTCHRRGVHAIGGMAAQIPDKRDAAKNEAALQRVRADKRREASAGYDGTWVAHPGLIPVAREEFDAVMPSPNQIERRRDDVRVDAHDLLAVPDGLKTLVGFKQNLRVGILYLASWLGGTGCVPIDGLMEDAATAEISRTQIWHWLRHGVLLDEGILVTAELVEELVSDLLETLRASVGSDDFDAGRFAGAAQIFTASVLAKELPDFLTLEAYPYILDTPQR
jgi:malate synthase